VKCSQLSRTAWSILIFALVGCRGSDLRHAEGELVVQWKDSSGTEHLDRDAEFVFPQAFPGERKTQVMVVRNLGRTSLRLASLELVDGAPVAIDAVRPADASFEVEFTPGFEVGPGQQVVLQLTFTARRDTPAPRSRLELTAEGVRAGEETARIVLQGSVGERPRCTGEGTFCGAGDYCSDMVCRQGECVSEAKPEGSACGVAEACRPRGRCLSGTCEQPLAEVCGTGDIQVTVTWDHLGKDLELHLIRPMGFLNDTVGGSDCTWNTCISQQPDWGVPGDTSDDPRKDIDNVSTFGPENVFLRQPAPGTYAVMVEHWGSTGEPCTADVTVTVAGQVALQRSINLFSSHHVWDVARIEWPAATVTPVDQDIDCTASWGVDTRGCDLRLP
jgi:hypothetical protein